MEEVAIIGGGVIGLTTGLHLAKKGFSVTMFSKDHPSDTTSNKAAAIWFPYAALPQHKVNRWSRISLDYYRDLASKRASGVSWVDLWVMDRPDQAGSWQSALPSTYYSKIEFALLPPGYDHGYLVNVPMIDTSLYLPYLFAEFRQKGNFYMKHIYSLEEPSNHFDWVVNCTGLEASVLVQDSQLYPIRGQIVKIKKQANIRYMADDHGPNALAYVIPRHDCIVLGGSAKPHDNNLDPDLVESQEIIERCTNLHPGLVPEIIDNVVGLRPGRTEVRLEKDPALPKVIHNYGHGGSGFTVAWGCAEEVRTTIIEAKSGGS